MTNKILIILPNDSLGGAEQHLKNIALYYLAKGFAVEVRFLTREKTGAWRNIGKNSRLVFTKSDTEKGGLFEFVKGILDSRKISYDFLYTSHVHLTGLAGVLINFGFLKVNKFVGRESTSIFKRFSGLKLLMFKTFYKLGYNRLNLLVCQTEYMKRQLVDALPKLASAINIQVIPNPIDLEAIKEVEDMSLNFGEEKYLVSAGRLIPEKGFDILLKAFALVVPKFPHLKLIILGEGGERINLEELARELGLSGKVQLPGFTNNVYNYFKYASCCVVSSRIEGFPNVLLQMMSQNNTIVSTLCAGGIDEIPSIYTCEPNYVDRLADEIERSLINDNTKNRYVFDDFLSKRSVPAFVRQINEFLNV